MRRIAKPWGATLALSVVFSSALPDSKGVDPARGPSLEVGAGITQSRPGAEFLFGSVPFASAHASTILETSEGLVTAWFGGSWEGADDMGIWVSRQAGDARTRPIEAATGMQADGRRYPCWNPVLFNMPDGAIALFYKVGPGPQSWWGMLRTSVDGGRTWLPAERLPDGILGPIKNKPVTLPGGEIISPSSADACRPWVAHGQDGCSRPGRRTVESVGAR